MSREWLNQPGNPAMAEWELKAEDIYAGVMVVDLALAAFRAALSADHEAYAPILGGDELDGIRRLDERDRGSARESIDSAAHEGVAAGQPASHAPVCASRHGRDAQPSRLRPALLQAVPAQLSPGTRHEASLTPRLAAQREPGTDSGMAHAVSLA
jgi:hypothetical protein